jgi:hypothetical protein
VSEEGLLGTPVELGDAERARLPADQVDLPAGVLIDDIEEGLSTVGIKGGLAADVVSIAG